MCDKSLCPQYVHDATLAIDTPSKFHQNVLVSRDRAVDNIVSQSASSLCWPWLDQAGGAMECRSHF
jgi:hypothetical protein